jgi:predicted helicase
LLLYLAILRTAINKIKFFIDNYNNFLSTKQKCNLIKWNSSLENFAKQGLVAEYSDIYINKSLYRPFNKVSVYTDRLLNHRLTNNHYEIYSKSLNIYNKVIILPGLASPKNFHILSSMYIPDMNCLPAGCQCISLYTYDQSGNRIENITNWGLKQFQDHYCKGDSGRGSLRTAPTITKLDIFHYTYAVLHNPAYREKYELNLKREFPRIPFYDNFRQWVAWGRQLMDLHVNYETIEPYTLKRVDFDPPFPPLKRGE